MKLKILYFDIETAPLLAHVWHVFGDYVGIDQLVNDSFVLCWAAKWDGQKKIISDRLTPQEALDQDDSRIIASLADLIRQADVVVAHNGDSFDLPVLRKRLLLMGEEPLGPVQSIDTYQLSKRNFKMEMNKLDFLADRLGVGRKIKTEFSLWREAYQGDEKALREMERYNKYDVVLLEEVFNRMRPHVNGLIRLHEAETEWDFLCTNCGTEGIENFMRRGTVRTKASTFQQWMCKECHKYYRERTSIKRHKGRFVPL